MTERELQYITDILKGREPQKQPEDWYGLLGFLQSHRIAGLFYNRAKRQGIPLPKRADKLLRESFERQKRRTEFLRGYIAELSEALQNSGAECVFLKGSVLSNLSDNEIYADGERSSNDIDLLAEPSCVGEIEKVLRELGYVQGEYSAGEKTIRPFTRLEIVKRRMNRGETAPFIKRTGNTEIPFIEVDINFSLGNTPGDGQELLAEMVGTGLDYKGKVPLRVPGEEMFFLHLILHQYKESCLYFMVERGKELDLYKLADIYYLIKAEAFDQKKAVEIANQYQIIDRLGAVLQQVGEVFEEDAILTEAQKYGGEQPDVIDYERKRLYEWTAPIRERICSYNALKYLRQKGEI